MKQAFFFPTASWWRIQWQRVKFSAIALIRAKAAVLPLLFLHHQCKFNTVKKAYVLVLLLKLFQPHEPPARVPATPGKGFGVSQESVDLALGTIHCSVQWQNIIVQMFNVHLYIDVQIDSHSTASSSMWSVLKLTPIKQKSFIYFFLFLFGSSQSLYTESGCRVFWSA